MKPSVRPEFAAAASLPPDEGYWCALFRRFLDRAGPVRRTQLAAYISGELKGRLKVGTACSGTDGAVEALRAFARVLDVDMQSALEIEHAFASEKHEGKQQFLKTCFPGLGKLFGDALDLYKGVAHDKVSGSAQQVDMDLDVFLAGFPCVDASPLNSSSVTSENRGCLMDGSLRTGSIFVGICQYLRQRQKRVQFVVLENVPGLLLRPEEGPSNADTACYFLELDGFFIVIWLLCPRLFGVPQSRARLYFLAIEKRVLDDLGMDEAQAEVCLTEAMNTLVGSAMQNLKDYILPGHHELVQKHYVHCASRAARHSDDWHGLTESTWGVFKAPAHLAHQRSAIKVRWPKKHVQLFERQGLDWCTHSEPAFACKQLYPGLHALTQREFEVLRLAGVASFPQTPLRLVEISQAAWRLQSTSSHAGAMVPQGRRYITTQCRVLLGIEELRLQSLWFSETVLGKMDDSLLGNLAGNAFEVSCCSAVMFSALLLLASSMPATAPALPLSVGDGLGPEGDDAVTELRSLWRRSKRRPASSSRLLGETGNSCCFLLKSAKRGLDSGV